MYPFMRIPSFLCFQREKKDPSKIMRSKPQYPTNTILIILCSFFFFLLLLFIILTSSSNSHPNSSPPTKHAKQESNSLQSPSCPSLPLTSTKTPPSLANALVHYATTNITPQQTLQEISVTLRVLERKSPCNFLVFGLGHDSLMWTSLNLGGRTVFLEEDNSWIAHIKESIPSLEAYHVLYDTKVHQADEMLAKTIGCKVVSDPRISKCQLAHKGFPSEIYEVEWDLIMVDAPTGFHEEAPGRMTAIYTAGLMARNKESGETDVFVHDVDRVVEDKFSKVFLCEGYLVEQAGRLRHFNVPSHRARSGRPFCP